VWVNRDGAAGERFLLRGGVCWVGGGGRREFDEDDFGGFCIVAPLTLAKTRFALGAMGPFFGFAWRVVRTYRVGI
jgi:hypothetical protein